MGPGPIEILTQSGGFLYPILGVALLGLLAIGYYLQAYLSERKIWSKIRQAIRLPHVSPEDLVEMQSSLPDGSLVTMGILLASDVVARSESDVQIEFDEARRIWRSRFERIADMVVVLSDVAGGLGLLGTVWGMYQTFFSGSVDKATILTGMGVALSTTLLGLIVSIVLTLCLSFVQMVRGRLEEEISDWMMTLRQVLATFGRTGAQAEKKIPA